MVNICWTEPFLWLWSHIALPRADWRPVLGSWLMGDHTLTLNTLYVRRCWHCNYSWTIWYTGGICFINFIHYAITIIQIKLLSSSRVSSWWTPWDFSYKSTGSHYRIGMLEVAFNFPFCCRFVFVMENIISVFEGPWPECWTFHSGQTCKQCLIMFTMWVESIILPFWQLVPFPYSKCLADYQLDYTPHI